MELKEEYKTTEEKEAEFEMLVGQTIKAVSFKYMNMIEISFEDGKQNLYINLDDSYLANHP